jgi:NAD(P)-dependent dehydrogenase (short-subunit alcohol dehydrogenase family)
MFDERGKQEAHHHCGCNTDTKIPALADEKEIYRVNKEIETHDAVDEQEEQATVEASRRDFLRMGGMGLAGMAGAAALGLQPSDVYAEAKKSGEKRVTILFDSWNHMMPALAREMVRRNHDLVLGQARDKELIKELREMGARIEVVEDTEDQVKLETFQKLVDRAQEAFGGFNSACIRTGHHVNASALTGTEKDLDTVYGGNLKSVFFALQAIVPPLAAQGSGQVVINTSAGASRPQPPQALYCATRQAANGLVRATALEVAAKGVTINATGTAGMEYPSYLHMVGADESPEKRKAAMDSFPMKRFIQPEDAASFVATLIDGTATGQTGQFYSIDAGFSII